MLAERETAKLFFAHIRHRPPVIGKAVIYSALSTFLIRCYSLLVTTIRCHC